MCPISWAASWRRRQGHLQHLRVLGLAFLIVGYQTLRDQVILPYAEGTEGNLSLDDLASAGIDHSASVGPAARGAVNPLDDVVTNVHRIGVGREHDEPERVAESCGFERLIPPVTPFEQRGTDGFGSSGIEVVDDGLDRVADDRAGIFLDEAVTRDKAFVD